jgi:uncharacterized protein (DUF433 family)
MNWRDRITLDAAVLAGKPVVRGSRLAVDFIVGLLGQGWTEADILRNYPGITHDDIAACLQYASEILQSEKVYDGSKQQIRALNVQTFGRRACAR